jgi:hypothetical protein
MLPVSVTIIQRITINYCEANSNVLIPCQFTASPRSVTLFHASSVSKIWKPYRIAIFFAIFPMLPTLGPLLSEYGLTVSHPFVPCSRCTYIEMPKVFEATIYRNWPTTMFPWWPPIRQARRIRQVQWSRNNKNINIVTIFIPNRVSGEESNCCCCRCRVDGGDHGFFRRFARGVWLGDPAS